MTRPRIISLAAVGAIAAAFIFQARLAFVPNQAVAMQVRSAIEHAGSLQAVEDILERRYKVLGKGVGGGFFKKGSQLQKPDPNLMSFHLLVGEYHLPFLTSVEAEVVVAKDGAVRDVTIRRSVDAL
jgi:hypothetical protein